MPAKRVIILNRVHPSAPHYRYVLWADVPAGNQIAYRNPSAVSAYENATAAELQAIRDGIVAEKAGEQSWDAIAMTAVQAWLEAQWQAWQNEVTALVAWSDYGRHWTGASWVASAGVPMVGVRQASIDPPTFFALTPVSAFGTNKFHFVLHNGLSTTLAQSVPLRVRLVVVIPGTAAVTGAAPTLWTLRRREAPTTPPSGTGSFAPAAADSAQLIPAGVAFYNAPQVAPAGGTVTVFHEFIPQADEAKLTTLDAPTRVAIGTWGGQVIYDAKSVSPGKPITLRAGETLEVQQSATAGTGNCRVLVVLTVG